MSSFRQFMYQFQKGFGVIIYRIFTSGFTALRHERVTYVIKAIVLTLVLLYVITIPIRIALLILQYIMWRLSFIKLANILMKQRLSLTFFNMFMDAVWYIPLFILFLSRSLGLFPSTPFDKTIMDKTNSFGSLLLSADTKQTTFTGTTFLLKRIVVLVLVTVLTFTSRFLPGTRILLSLSILTFLQLRRVIFEIHYTDGMSITLYTLSLSMLISNRFVQLLLYGAKLYLTAQALSREFLFPYFSKVTARMEEKDKKQYRWLLFGFGCGMTLFYAVPIFGLILYPVFQMAAVDLLIVMIDGQKLSFLTMYPELQEFFTKSPAEPQQISRDTELELIQRNKTLPPKRKGTKRNVRPPPRKKKSVPPPPPPPNPVKLQTSDTDIYNVNASVAKNHLDDMLDDMLCHIEDKPNSNTVRNVMEEKKEEMNIMIPPKKKKKKKKLVLYAEDATRLFKKMSDGKRFKNGIALRKTCNILSVAWELPEENGRILPSKVARHFKQVLPSKKTAKTVKKNVSKVKRPSLTSPISPIALMQSKSGDLSYGTSPKLNKAQTVRGHMHQAWLDIDDEKSHEVRRSMMELSATKDLVSDLKPQRKQKSMVSTLESLMAQDPNRTISEDVDTNVIRKARRRSMTDLDLDRNKMNYSVDLDQMVVDEVEQMIEAKKKSKSSQEGNYALESFFD